MGPHTVSSNSHDTAHELLLCRSHAVAKRSTFCGRSWSVWEFSQAILSRVCSRLLGCEILKACSVSFMYTNVEPCMHHVQRWLHQPAAHEHPGEVACAWALDLGQSLACPGRCLPWTCLPTTVTTVELTWKKRHWQSIQTVLKSSMPNQAIKLSSSLNKHPWCHHIKLFHMTPHHSSLWLHLASP